MSQAVHVIRLYGGHYEVIALDSFGRTLRHRTYRYGSKRRQWAVEQARQWAERFYLYYDGSVAD